MIHMTRDKLQNAIAVMQAFLDGKKLQAKTVGSNHWQDVTTPIWDWFGNDYRIKPEPKEIWVVETSFGGVYFTSKEEAAQFSAKYVKEADPKITKFIEATTE